MLGDGPRGAAGARGARARPVPRPRSSRRCSPIPTRTARTSTARRCGSSACSSCGCRSTWDERRRRPGGRRDRRRPGRAGDGPPPRAPRPRLHDPRSRRRAGRGVARPLGLAAAVHPRPARRAPRPAVPGRPGPLSDARRGRRLPDRLRRRAAGRVRQPRARAAPRRRDLPARAGRPPRRGAAGRGGDGPVPGAADARPRMRPLARGAGAALERLPPPGRPARRAGARGRRRQHGFQIAEELVATREVHLAIGSRQTPMPQRMLGRDLFDWLVALASCA